MKANEDVKVIIPVNRGLITSEAIEQEETQRKLITQYIRKNLKKGVDYYELTIGGRKSKPSLSKPGSEKFMSLFHLRAVFAKDDETWEMSGRKPGLICYRCELLSKSGNVVGEGRGARDVAKDNGDYNKAIKMAEKSAQIDAILRTGALTDFFTQDLEDMDITGVNNDPELKKKERIMKMLNKIHYRRITELEEIQHLIQEHTQLELVKDNFDEIINRLGVILDEQAAVQGNDRS